MDTAKSLTAEAKQLKEKFDFAGQLSDLEKQAVLDDHNEGLTESKTKKKADGFKAITKMLRKQELSDTEKALITGGSNGEDLLVPEDVRLEIRELRKQYQAAKDLLTVVPTTTLSGSFNFEAGDAITGLVDMTEDTDIDSSEAPKFARKQFAIKFMGKLIPISNTLLGAERAGLLAYLNRWFVKNAIISENNKIFATLKTGKAAKAIKGWEAFKSSINKDLDPDALIGAKIVTNQTGFDILDNEKDANGRPILQPNPMEPTKKLFHGLPIIAFSDAQLPNVSGKAPVFYGALDAGGYFIDYQQMQLATSEHYLFGKNQNCLRVIEGFDVIQADTNAYIYGTLEATPAPAA